MPRPNRSSKPGWLQHTITRGVGRRPIFESVGDYHYFERLMKRTFLAEDCGAQLVSYTLMPNHVHQILGGDLVGISKAMQSQLQPYAQWFNRRRGRDGPLFSQRYSSWPMDTGSGFIRTLRYIDQNPVKAGLVKYPQEYAWGSAQGYLGGRLPPWIDSSLVRLHLQRDLSAGATLAAAYQSRICKPMSGAEHAELEQRIQKACSGRAAGLAVLEYNGPDSLQWYEERARLADGFQMLVQRMITPGQVDAFLHGVANSAEFAQEAARPLPRKSTWLDLARVALLRGVCALQVREVAKVTGVAVSTTTRRLQRHSTMMEQQQVYRSFFTRLIGQLEQATAWL